MDWFTAIDWQNIFMPDKPLLEIFIRGSIIYLVLFCLLRFFMNRPAGSLGTADLLVVVLIADASQNAMAGDYKSLPDGILLVGTIVFWSMFLDWLGYHFPLVAKLIYPAPLMLIAKGKMLPQNMRREFITREELLSQLRQQGIDDVKKVRKACLEGDGKISVVPYKR